MQSNVTRHAPAGADTTGYVYRNAAEMWKRELQGDLYDPQTGWYGKALAYWEKTPATVQGMLGGLDYVHADDIAESRAFLLDLPDRGTHRALDCGAGIGRITKNLLTSLYSVTDLLEPVPHILEKAKEELAGLPVGSFMLSSMERAELPANTYDLIVVQWCAIYLTDDDFVRFFAHCKQALTPHGYIFFKENYFPEDRFLVDKDDSSLTRSDAHYKRLFARAGVVLVKERAQQQWPSSLIPVNMYALR